MCFFLPHLSQIYMKPFTQVSCVGNHLEKNKIPFALFSKTFSSKQTSAENSMLSFPCDAI